MKLAAIQYRPPKGQPEAARAAIRGLLDEAGAGGASLAVLPEMATTGYIWSSPQEIGPLTEPPDGATCALLSEAARAHGMWIVCGFAEHALLAGRVGPSGGRMATLYNSALVVNPEGERVACYRKVLLYDLDLSWATPGRRRLIVPTTMGRMVPAICMDLNDDRFVDFLHAAEATVLPFCTNWLREDGVGLHDYWRARLGGWPGWFVAANTWGTELGTRFAGRSAILAPDGSIRAEAAEEGDQVLIVDTEDGSGAAAG
jgi:predicted amidohydrolase